MNTLKKRRSTRVHLTVSVAELVGIKQEMVRRWKAARPHSDAKLELRGVMRGLGMAIAAALHHDDPKGPMLSTRPATEGKPQGTDGRRRKSL